VSRFKICTYELGDGSLTVEKQDRIQKAFEPEAERLRSLSIEIDFGQSGPTAAQEISGD
jgi:hypothetical protein